jgi:hypothetical protein
VLSETYKQLKFSPIDTVSVVHEKAEKRSVCEANLLLVVLFQLLVVEASDCDRTAQNSSVLSPKPVHVAIKQ